MAMVDDAKVSRLRSLLGLDRAQPRVPLPASLVINSDVNATLWRFLKARGGNMEKAYNMLVDCIRWRADNKIARCARLSGSSAGQAQEGRLQGTRPSLRGTAPAHTHTRGALRVT